MVFSIATFFFAFLACLLSLSYLFSNSKAKKGKNGSLSLPPGPWGLPLLGHLHMLGDSPHRNLQRMAKKYGPIMFIRLGVAPTIVVSSPESAELFLKTHDSVFASRPKLKVLDYLGYGQGRELVFGLYGTYWRNMRRLCSLQLFTSSKHELFSPMRKEEVLNFVESIKNTTKAGSIIDVSAKVESLNEDMTYRMIFGFKDDRFNIKSSIQEAVELGGTFFLADYIPFIGALDFQGVRPRLKAVQKVLDGFLEDIINEHVHDAKEVQGQQRDLIDVLLSTTESNNTQEVHLDRESTKAILFNLLAAAMDTSSTSINWIMAELLRHPRVMKLVQEELEHNVGLNRMVNETDLINLDYLKMVIKEGMRLHAVAPFLIPHASTEDVIVNGYFVPKNSRVLINTWAIGRDPNVWSENAQEFYPERFIGSNIDVQGHDYQLLPFGSGRRKCPGMQIGMTVVQLVVAQLVHCFNLELPDGMPPENLDMTEKFGITLTRAKHLLAIPTYRLTDELII